MMTVSQNVYVHSSPPKAISGHGAAIRTWVRNGDLDRLETVILDGQGARLLGLIESTSDAKVKAFLKSVPSYMAKVDLIHDAVIRGSLRETQSLLDKRRLVTGRDAVGRGLAHKAVLYNHKSLLDWLGRKFPEVVHLKDNEGRTPLHYTASLQSPNELYNCLISLGSNPEQPDIHGRKPSYYVEHPDELDIESPFNRSHPRRGGGGGGGGGNKQPSNRHTPISSPQQGSDPSFKQLSGSSPGVTRAQIRIWIHERDIPKLEGIVWSGKGDKLLLETTNNSKVRRFLDNVPHLLQRIKQIHSAAVKNDVETLKQVKNRTDIWEVFKAKDQHGLTAVHKAAGLGNREVVEWFAYEMEDALRERDSDGKSVLGYAKGDLNPFLGRYLGDQSGHGGGNAEVDARWLRYIPDAPRVVGEMGSWDRESGNATTSNKKRKQSDESEFGGNKVRRASGGGDSTDDQSGGRVSGGGISLGAGSGISGDGDRHHDIVDVADGYLSKYDHLEVEQMDFEVPAEDNEDEPELVEAMRDGGLSPVKSIRDEHVVSTSPAHEVEEQHPPHAEEEEHDVEATDVGLTKAEVEQEEPGIAEEEEPPMDEEVKMDGTEFEAESKVFEGSGSGIANHNHNPTTSDVDEYIAMGNMEALVNMVLEGKGQLLLDKSSPQNPEVQEFLQNVPAYMAKIASIHAAANNGNLRDLQSLLDRKRLAQATDEWGRVALHKAVLGGHPNVVRYLAANYPQSLNVCDTKGRSPLHYAATLGDQGSIYKTLIQAGANPNLRDVVNNTPGIYLRRADLLPQSELLFEEEEVQAVEATENRSANKRGVSPGVIGSASKNVDTWSRPPSPSPPNTPQQSLLLLSSNDPAEVDPLQLQLLESTYTQISQPESVWRKTWTKLTKRTKRDIAKEYVLKYLSREVFDLLKGRSTPHATLLDCIKFYPQFFLVAPDPHSYWVFREVFFTAISGHSGESRKGGLCFGGESRWPDMEDVDIAAKFIRQVRIRISRNVRPYCFVGLLRKEGLARVEKVVGRAVEDGIEGFVKGGEKWRRVVVEGASPTDMEAIVKMEATSLSRFWPHHRCVYTSGNRQVWVNAEDHIDFIVLSQYGKLGPMMESTLELYNAVKLDYHFSSEVGWLTVDPFRAGTGFKVSFLLRLPQLTLPAGLVELFRLCEGHFFSLELLEESCARVENIKCFGLDEGEIVVGMLRGVNEILKLESEKGRELDMIATGKLKKPMTTERPESFPAIWSEEGKYLASVLGDALVKGLTEVSQSRPEDPVEYLANFLKTYHDPNAGDEHGDNGEEVAHHHEAMALTAAEADTHTVGEEEPQGEAEEPPPESAEAPPDEGGEGEEDLAMKINKLDSDEENEGDLEEIVDERDDDNENQPQTGTRDDRGQSVLHFAAARPGGASTILAFLQNPSVNLAWRDAQLRTARDVAVGLGRVENVKVVDGWIVSLAVAGDKDSLEQLLLDGYDTFQVEESNMHVIELAEKAGKREVALFLRSIPDFMERLEMLHAAVKKSDLEQVRELCLKDNRLPLALLRGQTALHIAVLKEQFDIVRFLCEQFGPAVLRRVDNLERTPLHYAMGTDKVEKMTRILVRNGAKRVVKDLRGRQPSYYFINREEVVQLQQQ